MDYIGDFKEDATVYCYVVTNDSNGAPVAPSSAFEAADVVIYKNASATQKTSTNGITMTSPFDSIVGFHQISIDTSNDTGDSGFWETGSDYTVVLDPDETVDSQSVMSVVCQFSIENRFKPVDAPEKNVALNGIPFRMLDNGDHVTAETGLTVTAQRAIDGGSFATATGSVVEVGNGYYEFNASAADMNGDRIIFRFSNAAADDAFVYIKTITQ